MTYLFSDRKLFEPDPAFTRLEQDAEADGAADAVAAVPMPEHPSVAYLRGYCRGLESVIQDQQRMLDEFALQPQPVDDALTF